MVLVKHCDKRWHPPIIFGTTGAKWVKDAVIISASSSSGGAWILTRVHKLPNIALAAHLEITDKRTVENLGDKLSGN